LNHIRSLLGIPNRFNHFGKRSKLAYHSQDDTAEQQEQEHSNFHDDASPVRSPAPGLAMVPLLETLTQ
jgi:hypothetical protein